MTTVRVALVEDNPITQARLRDVLQAAPTVELLFACARGGDMLAWLRLHRPDVLLVDLGLPDMSGLDVIADCHRRYPTTEIMVITMFGDEVNMMAAFAQGARGYLLKDGSEQDLARHVLALHVGGSPMSPVIARQLLARLTAPAPQYRAEPAAVPPPDVLSGRELELLSVLSRGYTYGEAAALLGIAVNTVHSHVKNIYAKLDVHSRAEAVFEARNMGLI